MNPHNYPDPSLEGSMRRSLRVGLVDSNLFISSNAYKNKLRLVSLIEINRFEQ